MRPAAALAPALLGAAAADGQPQCPGESVAFCHPIAQGVAESDDVTVPDADAALRGRPAAQRDAVAGAHGTTANTEPESVAQLSSATQEITDEPLPDLSAALLRV